MMQNWLRPEILAVTLRAADWSAENPDRLREILYDLNRKGY